MVNSDGINLVCSLCSLDCLCSASTGAHHTGRRAIRLNQDYRVKYLNPVDCSVG